MADDPWFDDELASYDEEDDCEALECGEDELVLDCGLEGCLMQGVHRRYECHTAPTSDLEFDWTIDVPF